MDKKIIIGVVVVFAIALVLLLIPKAPAPENNLETQPAGEVAEELGLSEPDGVNISQSGEETGGLTEEDKTIEIKKEMNEYHLVTLKTNLGDIVFRTYDNDAPKTVANFIALAEKSFYDGVIFHRVIDGFMIQGGDPTGTGRGGPGYAFEDELNSSTESYKKGYVKGTVAMANAGPNTNGSQFFIMVANVPLPHDYSIFGSVVSGQDVADRISLVPRDRSDKPLSPVVIEKVTVEEGK